MVANPSAENPLTLVVSPGAEDPLTLVVSPSAEDSLTLVVSPRAEDPLTVVASRSAVVQTVGPQAFALGAGPVAPDRPEAFAVRAQHAPRLPPPASGS